MNESWECRPPQRSGQVALSLLGVAAVAVGVRALWEIAHLSPGLGWSLWLTVGLISWGMVAWTAYALLALRRARYRFTRDGIGLQWGLRAEQIPMNRVLWIEPASALDVRLRLPLFWWPGSLRGVRRVPDLGVVEYLADRPRHLILIATPERVYAISPERPQECLAAIRGLLELGALNPLPEVHQHPAMLLRTLWADRAVRALLLGLLAVNLLIFARASLRMSQLDQVVMNYGPDGTPLSPVPATRLLFLPLMNGWFSLALAVVGAAFYRKEERRALSFVVWFSALAASVVLAVALWRMG